MRNRIHIAARLSLSLWLLAGTVVCLSLAPWFGWKPAAYTGETALSSSQANGVQSGAANNRFRRQTAIGSLFQQNDSQKPSRSAMTERRFDELIAKAQQNGAVSVIVGLNVSFQPEGEFASSQAVQEQRSSIALAQDAFLSRLGAYTADSVKRFETIPFIALEVDAAALERMRVFAEVVSIEEDIALKPALSESTQIVGATTAWARGFSGAGQTIAILDTGVDKNHPFLAGKVVSEACYSTNRSSEGFSSFCPNGVTESTAPGSGVNCPASVAGCDHGTHVAGIAAGRGNSFSGVARDANIISIKVFSRVNNNSICGSAATCVRAKTSDIIKGLERVLNLHNSGSFNIAAVNMSLGGERFTSNCDSYNPAMTAGINNLRSAGIATVVSSGNDGYGDALGWPACISTAISVGNTGDGSEGTTQDRVASDSNSASFLNLLAPGEMIYSSVPGGGFRSFRGTSMAAPHVAGAFAVLRSRAPNASVGQILSALESTGVKITDPGNGIAKPRIRINAALDALSGNSSCAVRTTIVIGQSLTGSLTSSDCQSSDGKYVDYYSFNGVSGQQIAVSLDATAFDAYLELLDSGGNVIVYDDDGGDGVNARIPADSGFFTLPATGVYTIAATSFRADSTGGYNLRLMAPTGCYRSYHVDAANNGWLDTGMDVIAGQPLSLTASGTACLIGQFCAGPEGYPGWGGIIMNALLYGKIGTDGQAFPVGASFQGNASRTGRLYLMVSDSYYPDNSGGFDVCLGNCSGAKFSSPTLTGPSDEQSNVGSIVNVGGTNYARVTLNWALNASTSVADSWLTVRDLSTNRLVFNQNIGSAQTYTIDLLPNSRYRWGVRAMPKTTANCVSEEVSRTFTTTIAQCGGGNFICEQFNSPPAQASFNGATFYDSTRREARLTSNTDYQRGSIFFTPTTLIDRFTATFQLRIDGQDGADGMTFAVIEGGANSLGQVGAGLGYENISGRSFAIEFDTFPNDGFDSSAKPHVGLNVNGSVTSIATAGLPLFQGQSNLTVRVVFDRGNVEVFLPSNPAPVLRATITNWTPFAGRFGFTAATGQKTQIHAVDSVVVDVQSAPACSYDLSAPGQSFPSAGGAGSVNVMAPGGCAWTATVSPGWIKITSGASGNGNGTVNYSVEPNADSSQRSGTIAIANRTFTVTQSGATPNPIPSLVSISPNSATAGGPAFTLTVNGSGFVNGSVVRWNGSNRATTFVSGAQLTAQISATDIAAAGAASVTVFNPTPGGGLSNPLTFTITQYASGIFINENFNNPPAQVSFNGDAVYDSARGEGLLTPNAGYRRGSIFFAPTTLIDRFTATFQLRIDGQNGADGMTFAVIESGANSLGAVGSGLGYENIPGRSFAIEFDTFPNSGLDPSVTPHVGLNLNGSVASGATGSLPAIQGQGNLTVRVVFDRGAVQVFLPEKQAAPVLNAAISNWTPFTGRFGFTAATGGYSQIHAVDSVVVELQSAPLCSYELSAPGQLFQAAGGAGSVSVRAPGGCAWTAAHNVPWITINFGASGSGDGLVSYSVDPNNSSSQRIGTMAIAGKTFTVTQDGVFNPPPTLALSFNGKTRDRVGQGETALSPDGSLDGVFTATLSPGSGTRTVARLDLTRSNGGRWNTTFGDGLWALGAAGSLDAPLLNSPDGAVGFPIAGGGSFVLFASDYNNSLFNPGDSFTLTVNFTDGTSSSATTTILTLPLTLSFNGKTRDRVGQGETALNPDGSPDGVFTATLLADGGTRNVTGLDLTRSGGGRWNTTFGDGLWALGAAGSLDALLFNNFDSTVNFFVAGGGSFYLFASDNNNSLFNPGDSFTLTINFADGTTATASATVPASSARAGDSSTPAYRAGEGRQRRLSVPHFPVGLIFNRKMWDRKIDQDR